MVKIWEEAAGDSSIEWGKGIRVWGGGVVQLALLLISWCYLVKYSADHPFFLQQNHIYSEKF